MRIGIEYNIGYPGVSKSFAKIIQQEDAPMKFYTNNTDRMIINAAYNPTIHSQVVNTTGYVGMGANNFWGEESGGEGPRSLLHLQGPYNAFANGGNGWRTWNKTGVYINENSDEMYVGLKNEFTLNGPNRSDAVIMWGDDQANINDGTADNFRLIFSGGFANGNGNGGTNPRDPFTSSGLETMRMTPFGKMGIGPLFNFTLPPARRLEILDYQNSNGTSANEPQLRLTFTQTTTPNTGVFTDLQTTSLGDLFIDPRSGTNKRRVGINTSTPNDKLEINSDVAVATGSSGLQFTDLTTASTINASAFTGSTKGVLSVDATGKVILVGDETVSPTSGLNVCGTGIPNNYLLRMDVTGTNTVCKSNVYDDYANVKVGIDDVTPSYKLDVAGDFGINGAMYYNGARMLFTEGPGGTGPMGSNLYLGINAGNTVTPNGSYANTAMGVLAMTNLSSSAGYNTAMGCLTLRDLTTGSGNTTSGSSSGFRTTTGMNNVFIGNKAAINNQTGSDNVAIGTNTASDQSSGSGDIGDENVMIGTNAGGALTTNADGNVCVGFSAGYFHKNGNRNIYIGRNANEDQFQNSNTFENLILVGENSMGQLVGTATTLSNAAAIGKNSTVNCDNCIVLGDDANTRTLMGYNDIPTLSGGAIANYRLYVNPIGSGRAAFFNGDCYSTGAYLPSDPSLKTNIQPMQSTDQILSALNPKTYYFDSNGRNARLNLPSGIQYGLLSTDVESVLPNLIAEQEVPATYDSLGNQVEPSFTFKSVNYVGLIPILLQKIKDQQEAIDSITNSTNTRLNQLESSISACCGTSSERSTTNKIDVELSSENTIILNQNDPNPFAEQTRITFTVPQEVLEAKIIFFDNSGHVLQTVKINERGAGQINVYGEKLSSGIYSYSLIADGKVIDTKKMVCVK